MPVVPIGLPINSIPLGSDYRREDSRRDGLESTQGERQALAVETEADELFRLDAIQLGYLTRPRGMARYYREHGMLPPRYLSFAVRRREFTNFDLDRGGDTAAI
jgi:hypothetical protein